MKPLLNTASKSDTGHGRTCRHAPTRWLATRTGARHASHASSSPGWTDPTDVPDPDSDDVIMTSVWRHHAQLACHVSDPSSDTSTQ